MFVGLGLGLNGIYSGEPTPGAPAWYEVDAYDDYIAGADFNRDRYFIPQSTGGTPITTRAGDGKFPRQEATFAEWLSVTAASTTQRTYWNENQKLTADLAVNAPRFTWDNGRKQLVRRAAAQNIALYSQTFSDAAWTKETAGGAFTYDVAVLGSQYAPDETQTATKMAKLNTNDGAGMYLTAGVAVGSSVRSDASIFVKYDGRDSVCFSAYSEQSGDATKYRENMFFFDFTTGVITGDATIGTDGELAVGSPAWTRTQHTRAATYVGQGWWRIHYASTCTAATTFYLSIFALGANGLRSGEGDGAAGHLVWGYDVKTGGTGLTEYIPTSGSAVTQAVETITPTTILQTVLGTSDPIPTGQHDFLAIEETSPGVFALVSVARATPDLVVFDGDSWFGGYRVENQSWPIQLSALLDRDTRPVDMFNNGYTNGGVASTQATAGWFTREIDVPYGDWTATNKILVWQPMNSDLAGSGATVASILAAAQAYLTAATAAGWKVILNTLPIWTLPNLDYIIGTSSDRDTFNTGLKNMTGYYALVDIGADAIMGNPAYLTDDDYFQQDDPSGIPHPTAGGYAIWAALAEPVIEIIRTNTADATPAAFTFTDVTSATFSTVYTSNTITVSGINVAAAVSITGGTYSKNGGAYVSTATTAVNGDTFAVRHTSSGSGSAATDTVLTIGGVSDTYTTTTVADTTPDAFTFTDIMDADISTVYESNTITVAGITAAAALTITDGEYSINGGAYASSATSVNNGDTVKVRHTSSASNSTATDTVLTIGGVSDTYTTTTEDVAPDWYEASTYDAQSVIADFNNDRYALPPLGSELVTNGDFATDTVWTKGTGWSIASGVATVTTPGSASAFSQPISVTGGKVYVVTFTVSNYVASTIIARFLGGSTVNGTTRSANGTYTEYLIAGTGNTSLSFIATSTSNLSIDNVSIKEVNLTATGRTYGSEMISVGDFSASGGPWSHPSGVGSISGGVLNASAIASGNTIALQGSVAFVAGKKYIATYTVASYTSGTVHLRITGGTSVQLTNRTAAGTYTEEFIANTGNVNVAFIAVSGTVTLTIDNLSVKEVTGLGVYPKRSATFDEVFAYTAASTQARTYIASTGTMRDATYGRQVAYYTTAFNSWSKSNCTVSDSIAAAPDSTTTASRITGTGAGVIGVALASSTFYTNLGIIYSVYAKAETADTIELYDNNAGSVSTFNLTTQGITNTLGTGSITSVGSGWYRISAYYPNSAKLFPSLSIRSASSTNTFLLWHPLIQIGVTSIAELVDYQENATSSATPGVNVSRFTYINTERQLRLENAGTNLCIRSQELNTGWTPTNLAVTANNGTAPDGATTADLLQASTTAASGSLLSTSASLAAATVHTASIYAKPGTTGWVHFQVTDNSANWWGAYFNVSTGVVGATRIGGDGALTSKTMVPVSNGGYRLIITGSFTAARTSYLNPSPINTDGSLSIVSGQNVSLWGAQLEASSFATDYIPTTSASVTRAIETARFSPLVEAILQRTAASVIVRADTSATSGHRRLVGHDSFRTMISAHATTTVVQTGGTGYDLQATLGGSTQNYNPLGAAMGFDAAGKSLVANGGTVATDAVALEVRSTIYLGRDGTPTYGDGYYDYVAISPERLPDATLQPLATTVDTSFASVVLQASFDGADAATAATDVKGHALTFAGNAQLDTAEKKFGTASLLLDGTGDYVHTPDHADWHLPGEFTIECWVRPTTQTGGIISQGLSNGQFNFSLYYVRSSSISKWFRFDMYETGFSAGAQLQLFGSGSNIDETIFHHVAVTRDASNSVRIFMDGVLQDTDTSTAGWNSTSQLRIGVNIAGQYLNGWIDEVRITKGVCRYTTNFTPRTAAFPTA